MNESDGAPVVRGRRRGGSDTRIDQQPAFVLHSYPWRETSLIVETLTRDHGRLALVARGAKRPTSQFRGLLNPFAPLALGFAGRGEIKSLVRVDWLGGFAPLRGDGLLAAFYLNELLVRLLPRGDSHPGLFASYAETLRTLALSVDNAAQEAALRAFELDLLRELGYAPPLDHTADGDAVQADGWYRVDAQQGVLSVPDARDDGCVRGRSLLALAARDWGDARAAADGKAVLRQLIRYHLNGQPLNTRRIFQDLRRLETAPV